MTLPSDKPCAVFTPDDIALISMACRFPGEVNSPVEFMQFLLEGGDGIQLVPSDRWNHEAYFDENKENKNKMYVNQGGFLKNIDLFEPQFFGISPKEAPAIDPQHRWLLELAFEAFENAGLKASELRGSNTAVYIGQFMHDYEQIQVDAMAHSLMSGHSATGPSMTLTANRISYTFDLTGPSVALDTACSSSLVALDFACQAIWRGDSDMAIAGGVNILLRPEMTMSICKASMLSPDGRCKSFDASANGYVRSEGAGVVLVKRYADAVRDGDPILAVIKATGVNQDGQTNGITVPNGIAQKRLLNTSLNRAGLRAEDVQYMEAHGTGTAVGDPIEVNAMGSVLKVRYEGDPRCVLGSVKSNIGHAEAAAGMAGLMKAVLSMNAGVIPRNINFSRLNPAISLDALNFHLAVENTPWPDTPGRVRTAAVNSFGFGGTNSNVIIQAGQPENALEQRLTGAPVVDENRQYWLPLSAKSEAALAALAQSYIDFLQGDGASLALEDICYTAALRRDHFKSRLVVSGSSKAELIQALSKFVAKEVAPAWVTGSSAGDYQDNITFVFSGMGTQWVGMGKTLYESHAVFKQAIDRCDQALQPLTGWSLVEKLYTHSEDELSNRTDLAQPAIFTVQVALAELLASWNIVPARIVGHSAGEVAAAYVAGALDFDGAIQVIYHRSRLQYLTEGSGKMLAVGMTEDALASYLQPFKNLVSIAAINSEDAITLAGDAGALQKIADQLEGEGIFNRFLSVNVPYHSPVMDQLKAPLIESLAGVKVSEPRTPIYSTVTGALMGAEGWGAEYWAENVRQPVFFKAAIDQMLLDGAECFLEVSAHPALASSIDKCAKQQGMQASVATCLKRDAVCADMIPRALSSLHILGARIDWQFLYPTGRHALLPNYQWQKESYWCESEAVRYARLNNVSPGAGLAIEDHVLLGAPLPSQAPMWQKSLSLQDLPFLADHRVDGEVVYPAAAYIDMGLALARKVTDGDSLTLENLVFHRAFFMNENAETKIETALDAASGRYSISAIDPQTQLWNLYSEGRFHSVAASPAKQQVSIESVIARLPDVYEAEAFYAHCQKLGLHYLEKFQAVKRAWFSGDESVVELSLPESLINQAPQHLLHPVILDGAFQSLFPTIQGGFLPVGIRQLRYHQRPGTHCYSLLTTHFKNDQEIYGDITIVDEDGNVAVEVLGISLKAIKGADTSAANLLYEFRWQEQELETSEASTGHWLVVPDSSGFAARVIAALQARQNKVTELAGPLTDKAAWEALLAPYASTCTGILDFSALDQEGADDLSSQALMEAVSRLALSSLALAQAVTQVEWKQALKHYVITGSAQIQSGAQINPVQASLWGFTRVLASEHPELSVSLVDLDDVSAAGLVDAIADETQSSVYEQEIAYRAGIRYVNRLQSLLPAGLQSYYAQQMRVLADTDNYRLDTSRHELVKVADPVLNAQDEVIVDVSSVIVGDTAWGLPGISICAGKVLAHGAGAGDIRSGDEVVALVSEPGRRISVSVNALAKKPEAISAEEALARVGFTLAAEVTWAACWGGQSVSQLLYVGAITQSSRELLSQAAARGIQVTACVDTVAGEAPSVTTLIQRDDAGWVERIPASLADVLIHDNHEVLDLRLLDNLKPCGVIIDWSPKALDALSLAALAARRVQYIRMDWSELMAYRAGFVGESLQRALLRGLSQKDGANTLPIEQWGAAEAGAEGASMLRLAGSASGLQARQGENLTLVKPDKTYLVTGGLGGLGLTMMDWLATQGAKSIVLTGRSQPGEFAAGKIQAVRDQGIHVEVAKTDIGDEAQVAQLFAQIAESLPPLAGIIHSAGVLDDGVIGSQTAEKFIKVLAPKVRGTWNLHRASEALPLDMFICFSSIAAIVGWSGQSNYATANSFMDSFCQYRQARGLPALSVNWGPWAEAGMAANLDQKDIDRMNDSGMLALRPKDAVEAMSTLLRFGVPQAGVFHVEWDKILKIYPNASRKTLLSHFMTESVAQVSDDVKQELMSLALPERQTALLPRVKGVLADVIGLSDPEQIDPAINVFEYGMNSLMAVEIKIKLQSLLSLTLPNTLVLKYPTAGAMTKAILDILAEQAATVTEPTQASSAGNIAVEAQIARLPDGENAPLSFSQMRLWLLDKIMGTSVNYHLVKLFHFAGQLDVDAYSKAWNYLVNRHAVLQTVMALNEDEQPYQMTLGLDRLAIPQSDLSAFDEAVKKSSFDEIVYKSVSTAFDLSSDLMLRTHLVKLSENEYVSVNVLHHIAADGWSLRVILDEFTAAYRAFSQQELPALPALPVTYQDYAYWQQQLKRQGQFDKQLAYWKTQLADMPQTHQLPLSHARPPVQSLDGDVFESIISAEDLNALKHCCQAQGATLFMGLWAAFSVLMARYSNAQDIAVGSPVANRDHEDIANLMGFFVNTLVFRVNVEQSLSFEQLLERCKGIALDAYANQQMPFEMLVDALVHERDMSQSPLVQVMLALQNNQLGTLELPGLAVSELPYRERYAKQDLLVSATEGENGLVLQWEYATALFARDAIARMAEHFGVLLSALVRAPTLNVYNVDMLTSKERAQWITERDSVALEIDSTLCMPHLFEQQVAKAPDQIAAQMGDAQMTYAQLNSAANRLAHYLVTERQVAPDTLVGVCMERSLDLLVSLLAIMKSGAAYLPLDPDYPAERLAFMLEHSQASTVITSTSCLAAVPSTTLQNIVLDSEPVQAALAALPATNLSVGENGLTPEHLAYVIYTSGSTGKPKGVMVTQANLVNFLMAMHQAPGISPSDSLLAVTSTSFDIHGLELFLPLVSGARVMIASREQTMDPGLLQQLMVQHGISMMQATPATWKMLLEADWQPSAPIRVLCGGEALSQSLADALLSRPQVELWNMYGPTETTIWSCVKSLKHQDKVVVGGPIANTTLAVLSVQGQLAPVGVEGELVIGGAGVARGYLHRPDLTAERFVQLTDVDGTEARYYRTGDLVRRLASGDIEFIGRTDFQVKVRGFRIELGEVETVLLAHPAVKDGVVAARKVGDQSALLISYVILSQDLSMDQLRSDMAQHLPEYMVPSRFIVLDQLPLTPNGKVDRKALPEPDAADTASVYQPPRTETEKRIQALWMSMFGLQETEVGLASNFFHIGGESLSVVRFVSLAAKQGLNFTVRQVMDAKTLGALAALENRDENGAARLKTYAPIQVDTACELLPEQEWFFSENYKNPEWFNAVSFMELQLPLEPALVETALNHVMTLHEVLQARFVRDGQRVRAFIAGSAPSVPFISEDLSHLSASEQQNRMLIVAEELQSRFSLEEGPLFSIAYFDLGEEHKPILCCAINHLIMDANSMDVLRDDFMETYFALSRGEPLPTKNYSYVDLTQQIKAFSKQPEMVSRLDYWLDQPWNTYAPYRKDFASPVAENCVASTREITGSLSVEETDLLMNQVVKGRQVPLINAIYFAVSRALKQVNDGSVLPVWHIASGRSFVAMNTSVDMSSVMGWFSMPSPRFIPWQAETDLVHGLMAVHQHLSSVPDNGCSYLPLLYTNDDRDLKVPAFPDEDKVVLNHLGMIDASTNNTQVLSAETKENPENYRSCLFKCHTKVEQGKLFIRWEYSSNQYQEATIQQMVTQFLTTMKALSCAKSVEGLSV